MTLLATLEDFFIYRGTTLGDATADEVTRATFALEAASEVVRGYCRRVFDVATETVTVHGTGTWSLLLPNPPILEITMVEDLDNLDENDDPVAIDPDDYRLDPDAGILRLVDNTIWWKGFRNYDVTMEHGYLLPDDSTVTDAPELPTDIQMVVISVANRAYDSGTSAGGSGATTSITIGEYTEAFDASSSSSETSRNTAGLSALEAGALDRYRLVRIG